MSNKLLSEQLQSFVRLFVNRIINEDFKDLSDIPIDDLDINVPRHSVRIMCTHHDNDSLLHTIIRLLIYGLFVFNGGVTDGYFTPYLWFQENNDFIPQIQLYFVDDPKTRPPGYKNRPLELVCSFRLPGVDIQETSSKAKIEKLANKIFTNFKNLKITKGKMKYTYVDKENKQILKCFVSSQSEALQLFKNVLEVLEIPYNDDYLVEHKPEKSYAVPEKHKVFGQTYEIERRRSGIVEFKKATIHIQGVRPVKLCDTIKVVDIDKLIQTFYN